MPVSIDNISQGITINQLTTWPVQTLPASDREKMLFPLFDDTERKDTYKININTLSSNISGLQVSQGGTGANNANDARVNLGITPAAIGAMSTNAIIDIAHGGTNASTAAQARLNLNAAYTNNNGQILAATTDGILYYTQAEGGVGANQRQGHEIRLLTKEIGISAYDATTNEYIWKLETPISIANGGTGATDKTNAINNLGVLSTTGGTLSGNLVIKSDSARVRLVNTSTSTTTSFLTNSTYAGLYDENNSKYIFSKKISDGTTNFFGNADTATKLKTARAIKTNLATTSAASFDGSGDINPGVSGILPIANGGTNASTAAAARNNLAAVQAGSGTSAGIFNSLGNTNQLFYIKSVASSKAASSIKGHNTWLVVRNDGLNVWDANNSTAPWNLTFPIPITLGGTGTTGTNATTARLSAAKNLTNEGVSSPGYVVGLTSGWSSFGYTTIQQLRNTMGLGNTTGVLPIANGGTGASVGFLDSPQVYNLKAGNSTTISVSGIKLIIIYCCPSGGAIVPIVVPNAFNATGADFQAADESSYIKFKLSKSGNTLYLNNISSNNNAAKITHIYRIY